MTWPGPASIWSKIGLVKQRVEKLLEDALVKVSSVLTDILGCRAGR